MHVPRLVACDIFECFDNITAMLTICSDLFISDQHLVIENYCFNVGLLIAAIVARECGF